MYRFSFHLTYWVKRFLIINSVVFLLLWFLSYFDFFIYIHQFLAFTPKFAVFNGYIWQFITYQFYQLLFDHFFTNMLTLFFLGPEIEKYLGGKRFLILYILTGCFAAIFFTFFLIPEMLLLLNATYEEILKWHSNIPMVGASGSLFLILIGWAYLFPNREIYIFGVFPFKAKWLVLILVLADILGTRYNKPIAYTAHLGGALFGLLYFHTVFRKYSYMLPMFEGLYTFFTKLGNTFRSFNSASFFKRKPKYKTYKEDNVYRSNAWDQKPNESKSQRTRNADNTRERIDELLDKINKSGLNSLSKEEREFLDKASRDKY